MLAVLLTERGLGGDGADLERRLIAVSTERSPRAAAARQLAERLATGLPSPSRGGSQRATRERGDGVGSPMACPTRPTPLRARIDVPGEPGSRPPPRGRAQRRRSAHPCLAGPRRQGAGRARPFRAGQWRGRHARRRRPAGRRALARRCRSAGQGAERPHHRSGGDRRGGHPRCARREYRDAAAKPSSTADRRAVRMRETVRLGAIVLSERMLPAPAGADADRAILDALRQHGLSLLPWGKEAETLRERLGWLHRGLGAPWPDVSDAALSPRWTTGCCPSFPARRPLPRSIRRVLRPA